MSKIFTSFSVLSEAIDMPEEDFFCPALWAKDFDSDGDYYYHQPHERWTTLRLLSYPDALGNRSKFFLYVFRPDGSVYNPKEFYDYFMYMRFIEAYHSGAYPEVGKIISPCLTLLEIETNSLDDYKDFLQTVLAYLKHTKGYLLPHGFFAEDFQKYFAVVGV